MIDPQKLTEQMEGTAPSAEPQTPLSREAWAKMNNVTLPEEVSRDGGEGSEGKPNG